MKYLTEAWYKLSSLTDLHFDFTIDERAASLDESYFESLVEETIQEAILLEEEIYNLDPREANEDNTDNLLMDLFFSELKSNPDLQANTEAPLVIEESEEEKLAREATIEAFINRPPFDSQAVRDEFLRNFEEKIHTLDSIYPSEILAQVTDPRVFSLGRCTEAVYKAIRNYSEANLKIVNETLEAASASQLTQVIPDEILEHFGSHDAEVIGTRVDGSDYLIELDPSNGFSDVRAYHFKQAEILKQSGPLEGCIWLYDELYRETADGSYEVHVLFGEKDNNKAVELTLRCQAIEFTV